jgi:hypothetical protein
MIQTFKDIPILSPPQLINEMKLCRDAGHPVLVWGGRGIGKTELPFQLACALDLDFMTQRVSQLDAVDLRGLPDIDRDMGVTVWRPPVFLPRFNPKRGGIFFWDEVNRPSCSATNNSVMEILNERRLGEYRFPDNWWTVAAANPDGGGTTKLNQAFSSRFFHFRLEPDPAQWANDWAPRNGIHDAVTAFIRFRPECLYSPNPDCATDGSNPRAWKWISDILHLNPVPELERAAVIGKIGPGVAGQFEAFQLIRRNCPRIQQIISSPDTEPVPDISDPMPLYAIASALARFASVVNIDNVVKYLRRMPEAFASFAVHDMALRSPVLKTCGAYTQWMLDHPDIQVQ